MNIHWIIQQNLTKNSLVKQLKTVIEADNAYIDLINVVPFSDELPKISTIDRFNIFYGSTTLMLNAAKHYPKGVFYDPATFQMDSYLQHWGDEMLNAQAELTTLGAFAKQNIEGTKEFFVRPNDDAKGFSGQVVDFATLEAWITDYNPEHYSVIHPELEIIVAPPQKITKEWRNFVVDGKVVSASRYLLNGQLSKSAEDVPKTMLDYTEARCLEFAPHPIFVIDIALCNEQYKIIECNCFNGTGFYAHNVSAIVQAVNNYIRKQF